MPESPTTRPRVALVAHGIHDHGGMERAFAELVRRIHRGLRGGRALHRPGRELPRPRRVAPHPGPVEAGAAPVRPVLRGRRGTAGADAGGPRPHPRRDRAERRRPGQRPLLHRRLRRVGRSARAARTCRRSAGRTRRSRACSSSLPSAGRTGRGRVSRVGAVSRGVARELERSFPGRATTVLTPNGVDRVRFRPDPDARREVRAETRDPRRRGRRAVRRRRLARERAGARDRRGRRGGPALAGPDPAARGRTRRRAPLPCARRRARGRSGA